MNGRQARARRRASAPLHVRDQRDAAERQAREGVKTLALALGADVPRSPRPGSRLGMRLELLEAGLEDGALELCPHLLAAPSPRVVCTALWTDRVWCGPACAPRELEGAERFRCDCCTAVENPIWTGLVSLGHVLVTFGLCRACYTEAVGP